MIRRIKPKSEEESKKRRNQLIVGGILIIIMLFSTIGYAFIGNNDDNSNGNNNGSGKKIKYNGYEFNNNNGFWVLNARRSNFVFQYNPKETEDVNVNIISNIKSINEYYNKPLYISPQDSIATNEITVNLNQVAQRVQYACLEGENCSSESELPIKNCEDNFIIIKKDKENETSIEQKDNCVFITGNEENIIKLTDEFLFKLLGVK